MEIRLRSTGQVMTDTEFRAAHLNTSFPALLSAELLDSYDADPVLNGPQPSADRYQTVARDGVEEIDGKWFTRFVLVDMADEAKAAMDAQQAASVRAERNRKLAETDWRFRSDLTPSQDWIDYCQTLRDVTTQSGFPWEIVWPEQPAN